MVCAVAQARAGPGAQQAKVDRVRMGTRVESGLTESHCKPKILLKARKTSKSQTSRNLRPS